MNINKVNRFTILIFAILAIVLSGSLEISAQTTDPSAIGDVSGKYRKSIELVIRDYLLTNPSIIREAMQALQELETRQQQEKIAESMKTFRDDIYSDADSPFVGNPNGDVTVVVFFDYNCGYCKRTLPELSALIANDPSLRIIYKEFPILGQTSQIAAQAAMASARQGKYAEFHEALLSTETANEESIKSISDQLGLNYATLQKDMADQALNSALLRNLNLGNSLGISGTPSYIVGNQIIPGAIDMESLARFVSIQRANLVNNAAKVDGKVLGAVK